jgi:GxxExxY protein
MPYQEEVANDELTYQILGIAYEVHNVLGPDLPEETYRDVMCDALKEEGLECETEMEIPVSFNGRVVAKRYADIVVAGEVVLELKAVKRLTDDHITQVGTNVRAAGLRRGLVLNFGGARVQKARYVNPNCPPLQNS